MDYKQKYEQLEKFIKDLYPHMSDYCKKKTEGMIPELKESEDERIKKEILNVFKQLDECTTICGRNYDYTKWIAWLKKQGEMKSDINDDILLRFAFYQYDDDTLYLSSVFVEECNRKRGYGSKVLKAAEEVAKIFRVSKIRLKVKRNTWMVEWYKKNGYEYLSSEGEYDWLEKRVEQKTAWSDEDEEHLNSILERLEGMCKKGATFTQTRFAVSEDKDWLKSLRSQPHWKPSEEQMYILEWLTTNVLDDGVVGKKAKAVLSTLIEQLKSL